MPHGDWDRLSAAGLRALEVLFRRPGGIGKPAAIRHVRLATWRMLERYALIRRDPDPPLKGWKPIDYEDTIGITREGMFNIGVDPDSH